MGNYETRSSMLSRKGEQTVSSNQKLQKQRKARFGILLELALKERASVQPVAQSKPAIAGESQGRDRDAGPTLPTPRSANLRRHEAGLVLASCPLGEFLELTIKERGSGSRWCDQNQRLLADHVVEAETQAPHCRRPRVLRLAVSEANTKSDCCRHAPESYSEHPLAFRRRGRNSCDRKPTISAWGSP